MCTHTDHIHPHVSPTVPQRTRREVLRLGALGLASALLSACDRTGRGRPQPPDTEPVTGSVRAADLAGFGAFRDKVRVLSDGRYFLIESDGMPSHTLMVGIRSWQQQVPLPQPYRGNNAWRVPVAPKHAASPISGRTALYRGAIAIAVDGVPIFNALNNRGDDAYLAGELDDFGGHAGRADDYHYHVAPVHLQALVAPGEPIGYALDGYALYGLTEPDGSAVTGLDEFNGHADAKHGYHYHATKTFPYINGGLRGEVTVSDDQVEPQPRTVPIRPSLQPLPGARITGFRQHDAKTFTLEYSLSGETGSVQYGFDARAYTFEFSGPGGARRMETYVIDPRAQR